MVRPNRIPAKYKRIAAREERPITWYIFWQFTLRWYDFQKVGDRK
jgi:hypothetical protein